MDNNFTEIEVLEKIKYIFENYVQAKCEEEDWGMGIEYNTYFFDDGGYYIECDADIDPLHMLTGSVYFYEKNENREQDIGSISCSIRTWLKDREQWELAKSIHKEANNIRKKTYKGIIVKMKKI